MYVRRRGGICRTVFVKEQCFHAVGVKDIWRASKKKGLDEFVGGIRYLL